MVAAPPGRRAKPLEPDRREFGQDPDEAAVRDAGTVENYRGRRSQPPCSPWTNTRPSPEHARVSGS